MRSHMRLQIALVSATLATDGATETFLPCVHRIYVPFQIGRINEILDAYLTSENLLLLVWLVVVLRVNGAS